jgi:hypothetical protein
MGGGKEAVSFSLIPKRCEGSSANMDLYSPKQIRKISRSSQTNPKTTPITIETRKNSSHGNSRAKEMNSRGPLGYGSAFSIPLLSHSDDERTAELLLPPFTKDQPSPGGFPLEQLEWQRKQSDQPAVPIRCQ